MLLLLTSLAAHAQSGWDTAGELRELVSSGSSFAIDAEGTQLSQGVHLDQRLRAAVGYDSDRHAFVTEWDLFTGQLAGSTWSLGESADERDRDQRTALTLAGVQPRKLHYAGIFGPVQLSLGLTTSHWGLGLVANSGAHAPLFGREDFGDRVIRTAVRTAPFRNAAGERAPTYVMLAFDTVYADDLAVLWDKQLAHQGIAALLHDRGPDGLAAGVYGVFRNQVERADGRTTRAGVLDVYGRLPLALGAYWTLTMQTEAVGLLGQTSRVQTYAGQEGIVLRSGAIVLHNKLSAKALDLHLNLGAASGDGRPDDGVSSDFTADRDFGVGMVLFDEVMGGIDAGSYALLTDPQYSGQAPDGVDLVASEGAWRRSAYLQPAVAVRPLDLLELRAGAVVAVSTGPIAQPFYSFRSGGVPRNHLDQDPSGRSLGTELDWAVRLQPVGDEALADWVIRPKLEIQGGHALLSKAMGGDSVHLIQGSVRAAW